MKDKNKTEKQPINELNDLFQQTAELENLKPESKKEVDKLLLLKHAFDFFPIGITIKDLQGKIIYTNVAEAEIHGYRIEEIINKYARMFAPQELWKPLTLEQLHEYGAWKRESLNIYKDGKVFPVQLTSNIIRNEKGIPVGIVTACEDITDRKRMEEALQKAHDRLEHLVEERTIELSITNDQLKTEIEVRKQTEEALMKLTNELKRSNTDLKDFAYVASHDLKKPLQSIEGFVKLLARRYKGKLDDKADEFIEYIINGIQRMQELIKDLLEYSQVGVKENKFEPTDCSGVVEKAVGNLQAAIEESNAVVTYDELPTVMFDTPQMISLFQNLIDNAIKFRGEEAPRIHISAERKGDEWVFSIRDNGIGIDPKDSERIFGMFQRLHSSTDYPGTGIGLATCRKIVELHGGRIWVESENGKGTIFYFTTPSR